MTDGTQGFPTQAFRYIDTRCCTLLGSRSTIWSPPSADASIDSGDWFITSAYADSRGQAFDLIQTGIEYELGAPDPPSCNLGQLVKALYYFVEVISNGVGFCYSRGYANWNVPHLHSVVRNQDGYWRAYRDGQYQEVRTQWDDCNGDACLVAALGEKDEADSGRWLARFAGAGRTPWQRWNGVSWITIDEAFDQEGENWSDPFGPFPGGIWYFQYED